jgi:hypothetical protein
MRLVFGVAGGRVGVAFESRSPPAASLMLIVEFNSFFRGTRVNSCL